MGFPTIIERIIVVPFENHSYTNVISSGPYFKTLAQTYSRPTNNKEACNPSLPCYLALSCGSTEGKCGTDSMSGLPRNINNVFRLVQVAGLTYGSWAESNNANRHIPATFYTDTVNSVKNFSDFQANYINGNLIPPNFCFVTPSLCNDAHDCAVSVADNWLKNTFNLPALLQKPWAQNTCFLIWWDEGYGSPKYVVFVSPISMGKTNTSSTSDYETLTTIEWLLGLGTCGNNDNPVTHPPMKDLFQVEPPVLTSIAIAPTSISISMNTSTQLTATCKDQNNNTMTCPTLTWESDNPSVSSVNSSGVVTGISIGTANVTASSGSITSNISTVTVTQPPVLTTIIVSPASVSINTNTSSQLTATCKDQNNNTMTCPTLTWASDNPSVASVNSSGMVTGIASGTANIKASSGSIISNVSVITVTTTPSRITVTNPTPGIIYIVGEPRVVRWKHAPGTGANVKIELLKAGVLSKTISSSTPNDDAFAWIIPVVSTGNDYQVRITSKTNAQDTGISGNFTIQGSTPPPVLTTITLSPASVSINTNTSTQLIAICKDQNNNAMTCPTLTWTSDNPSIASVNSSGVATGISSGMANITASSGSITSNISIVSVIQLPVLTTITLSPASVSINTNTSTQLIAICKDQNGNMMTCPLLSWTSDNPSVASVNSSGAVTGIAAGTANVIASSGSITSNISTVTVTQLPEKKFSIFDITPGNSTNIVGVLVTLDDTGAFTKDQACVEVCNKLGQI